MATEEVQIVIKGKFENKQAVIDAVKSIDKGITSVGEKSVKSQKQVNSLSSSLKKLAQIVGLSILAKKMVTFGKATLTAAGQMEQYDVAFTTMLGSAEKAKTLMEEAIEFAAKTPFQLDGVLDSTKQLLAYNTAQEEVIPTLRTLGDIAAGTGADIRLITKAWGDVKTKGKLAGQEVLQFANAGVPLVKELANTFNLTTKEVSEMQAKGQISFDMVNKAIQGMTAEGGKFFNLMDAQSKTFLGTVSNMQDGFFQLKVSIGQALLPVAQDTVNKLIILFDNLKKKVDDNKQAITDFALAIKKSFGFAISILKNFITAAKFLVSIPLIKWFGLAAIAVIALGKAFIFASKNKLIFLLVTMVQVLGWVINSVKNLYEGTNKASTFMQKSLMIMARAFEELKLAVTAAVGAILNKLSFLSKVPGFGWVDGAIKKFDELKESSINDINDIQAEIDRLNERKFDEEGEQVKKEDVAEDKNAKLLENLEEEKAIIEESNQAKFEQENEHQQAIADLQEKFRQGKIDLETLEDEEKAIKAEEELAKLNEWYLKQQELFGGNKQKELEIRQQYDAKKEELDKKQVEKQKFFSKQTLDGARSASGQLVALENSKHKELAAIGKAAALFNIGVDTAKGAIAAYASLSGIPIVGPALGAAAAAAVVAFGAEQAGAAAGASFAVGAGEIPQDMQAQLHAGEMVIPATFAESIRAGDLSIGGGVENQGGGGAGNIVNINFEGANFYGNVDDDIVIDIGNRISDLINENILSPISTGTV